MKRLQNLIWNNIRFLSALGVVFILIYLFSRIVIFFTVSYTLVEKLLTLTLLFSEAFIILHAIGYMIEVMTAKQPLGKKNYQLPDPAPSVAVVTAIKDEPKEVLTDTLLTFNGLEYPRKHLYLLDGSSKPDNQKMVDELARNYHVGVFRPERKPEKKAWIVNDFLKVCKEDLIAIFDADQNPMPSFLKETVPLLYSGKKMAFVQTPQFYTNVKNNPIAMAAAMQQAIFFENICEGKNSKNAMFCCGTNVLFNKKALLSVGGFDEESVTEDFATSILIHMKGYQSIYFNHVLAFGKGPESLPAYFKQQMRWATGTVSIFRKMLGLFVRKPFSLTPIQWWEYFLSGTYYFVGWAFFFLMLSPIVFLLFRVPSYFIQPQVYLSTYIPYLSFSMFIFYTTMTKRHYSLKNIFIGSVMAYISFPLLMKAVVYGMAGKKIPFIITPKGRTDRMSLYEVWPQLTLIFLSIVALVVGGLRMATEANALMYAASMFWVSYHLYILSYIFYFRKY